MQMMDRSIREQFIAVTKDKKIIAEAMTAIQCAAMAGKVADMFIIYEAKNKVVISEMPPGQLFYVDGEM